MIQIESLTIDEFRGIRHLELVLNGKSFVVWGPNGSGKSGVVDAIEFVLTGGVARLSGSGTGGVTIAKHGPHVHQRDNAAAATVSIGIRDAVSGETGLLTRNVKTATRYKLSPDTPTLRAAVDDVARHPELTLSRREIIRYVVAEAGKRAQEVQALLKLDRIDETRRLLRSVSTKTATARKTADGRVGPAETAMLRHLDLPSLLGAEMATEVNKRRTMLGLATISTVDIDTDLCEGVGAEGGGAAFDKASALRDVQALIDAIARHPELSSSANILGSALDELIADPTLGDALRHRALVESGLDLVSEASCPLCDAAWDSIEALREHLQQKLARSEAAHQLRTRIEEAATHVISDLGAIRALADTARQHAHAVSNTELTIQLRTWIEELSAVETKLGNVDTAVELRDRLALDLLAAPVEVASGVESLRAALEAKPDQSARAAATSFLTVAQERWTAVRLARAARDKADAADRAAKSIYDAYCIVADEALTTLYKTVEDEFAAYYRRINSDDEPTFHAELDPSGGKLDLTVDFYGLGMFPPAAYHSEGHQDGMGVCLYLALMRRLLGDDFRFAVLDDVVMSVDSGHRRQFCNLLKDSFPDVQFLITTHDEVWVRQMQSAGLIDRHSQAHFYGWTVDDGPAFDQGDVWERIVDDLDRDDVPGAAHKLRRHLEASASDIAESIGGRVPYRADASYELGVLLSAVNGRHNDLLKKAAASANSWDNDAAKKEVERLKQERSKVVPTQTTENWAINKLVHNNDGYSMSRADFSPVLDACREYLKLFHCPTCRGMIFVSGSVGSDESLRCSCGAYNLNLLTR